MSPPLRVALVGHAGNSVLVRGGLEVMLDQTALALQKLGVHAARRLREFEGRPDVFCFVGCFYGLYDAFQAARGTPRMVVPTLLMSDASLALWRRGVDRLRSRAPGSLLYTRRRILEQAELAVVNSEEEAQNARAFGARRLELVRGGVDLELFTPNPVELSELPTAWRDRARAWLSEPKRCVAVARFEQRKNQREVARACSDSGASALFIGRRSPTEPGFLDELAGSLPQGSQLWEDAPSELVRWALAASHVHALASRHETIGLVSLEAAASGCRPVAIDQATSREYLSPFGVLAASPDAQPLAQALRRAFERGRLSDEERALLEPLSWQAFAQRLAELMHGLAAARMSQ